MKFEWEVIDNLLFSCGGHQTARAKVLRGWIVSNRIFSDSTVISEGMVFVPDENHEWSIDK